MKKITLFLTAILMSTAVFAAPMSGIYKVGSEPGSDYTLLSTAVTDLNANGISADVVLEINSDITEIVNIGLINNSEFSITIRPDADVDRTITFNKSTDNAGPSGAFCIGIGMGLAWADISPTKNIVIDGFAVGGSTKRLKIATTATHNRGNGTFLLIDDCSNIQIKNCIIHHIGASTGSSNYGIYLRVNKLYATKKMPSNVIIENNTITATQNTASQGIGIYADAVPTSLATGIVIKNNIINARTRGLFLYYTDNLDVIGNEFHIVQTAAGVLSSAIMGNAGITGNVNVVGNKFIELKTYNSTTGDYGMKGIIASGGGTWNINNNFFLGPDKTFGSAETNNFSMLQAIRTGSTCVIRHNTFYMKSLTKKPVSNVASPTSSDPSYCSINIAGGTPEISNNIFISDESTVSNFFIRGTNGGVSDNNIFYFDAANTMAFINGNYATLDSYQLGSGKDTNSKFVNVNFMDAAAGDLRIVGASVGDQNLGVTRLDEVLKDMFGTDRASKTYAGAHEASNLSITNKAFTVTVPNGTEKVYLVGGFPDKAWDIDNPYELTATANANEFTGTYACEDGIEYKYFSEKDWDFSEAVYGEGANPPVARGNRTYNAADVVTIWMNVKKITLNASFAPDKGVPMELFVKGGFNSWATGIQMIKSGNTFSVVLDATYAAKYAANMEYKYYTNDAALDNWEASTDGSFINNRWSIAPIMNDEIARFTTELATNVNNVTVEARIMRTNSGIEVALSGEAKIELYNIKGMLLDNKTVNGSYSRALDNGIYIIRINGKATKFVK